MVMTDYAYNIMFSRINPNDCDTITKRGRFIKNSRKKPVRKPAHNN